MARTSALAVMRHRGREPTSKREFTKPEVTKKVNEQRRQVIPLVAGLEALLTNARTRQEEENPSSLVEKAKATARSALRALLHEMDGEMRQEELAEQSRASASAASLLELLATTDGFTHFTDLHLEAALCCETSVDGLANENGLVQLADFAERRRAFLSAAEYMVVHDGDRLLSTEDQRRRVVLLAAALDAVELVRFCTSRRDENSQAEYFDTSRALKVAVMRNAVRVVEFLATRALI